MRRHSLLWALAMLAFIPSLVTERPGGWLSAVGGERDAARAGGPVAANADGPAINSGSVILKGVFLRPPYRVTQTGDNVLVNGRVIGRLRAGAAGAAGRIERRLLQRGLLLQFDDESIAAFDEADGIEILRTLLSDARHGTKVRQLAEIEFETGSDGSGVNREYDWITSRHWGTLVAGFRPDDRLQQIVHEHDGASRRTRHNTATGSDPLGSPFRTRAWMVYGLTTGGMMLAVLAFGSLLSHPPASGAKWSDVADGEGYRQLPRFLLLIVLLSLYDFSCTAFIGRTGGFLELNPFGSRIMHQPLTLALFKSGGIGIGVVLLYRLHRYHGAQIAVWWACLVCTLVTIRWITFGSLFLSG